MIDRNCQTVGAMRGQMAGRSRAKRVNCRVRLRSVGTVGTGKRGRTRADDENPSSGGPGISEKMPVKLGRIDRIHPLGPSRRPRPGTIGTPAYSWSSNISSTLPWASRFQDLIADEYRAVEGETTEGREHGGEGVGLVPEVADPNSGIRRESLVSPTGDQSLPVIVPSAVDGQDHAADEGGFVAGKVERGVCDVRRST